MMRAFRNLNGVVTEILVDVGIDGQPILPPDTTINPMPEPLEGFYMTVVGTEWVRIPIQEPIVSFETRKTEALERLNQYKNWYQEQDIEYNGLMFQADSQARDRITQAIVAYREFKYLPPAWISRDNIPFVLSSIEDFAPLATAIMGAFSTRFFEMDQIRQQIIKATDMMELNQVNIPTIQYL